MRQNASAVLQKDGSHNLAMIDSYLKEIAAGSQAALGKLYTATSASVYSFAVSMLKDPHDAQDILHDTYVRIWQNASGYRPRGKPMAWILTIAKNLSIAKLRETRRVSFSPWEEWERTLTDTSPFTQEDKVVLQAAMSILCEEEYKVVMLHAVSGLKHREIAALLELPLPTVLSKYSRALKKLKAQMKEGE